MLYVLAQISAEKIPRSGVIHPESLIRLRRHKRWLTSICWVTSGIAVEFAESWGDVVDANASQFTGSVRVTTSDTGTRRGHGQARIGAR
jgi:hypothetical protein